MLHLKDDEVIAERYRIESFISSGGCGSVYKARHLQLDIDVALKTLDLDHAEAIPGEAPASFVRFKREAQALSRLHHSNIVGVMDFGFIGTTTPYLVMDYVPGLPLLQWGAVRKPSINQWLEVFRQVFSGLDHAHATGVIHRDLKSANVLVRGPVERPKVTVIDWGIAFSGVRMTRTGDVIGTPGFIDPALYDNPQTPYTAQSDLYAVGGLLYVALCGRPPFKLDPSMTEVQRLMVYKTNEIIRPDTLRSDLPKALIIFIHRLMATDRSDRTPTARAALAIIDLLEKGQELVSEDFSALHARYQPLPPDDDTDLELVIDDPGPLLDDKPKTRHDSPRAAAKAGPDLATKDAADLAEFELARAHSDPIHSQAEMLLIDSGQFRIADPSPPRPSSANPVIAAASDEASGKITLSDPDSDGGLPKKPKPLDLAPAIASSPKTSAKATSEPSKPSAPSTPEELAQFIAAQMSAYVPGKAPSALSRFGVSSLLFLSLAILAVSAWLFTHGALNSAQAGQAPMVRREFSPADLETKKDTSTLAQFAAVNAQAAGLPTLSTMTHNASLTADYPAVIGTPPAPSLPSTHQASHALNVGGQRTAPPADDGIDRTLAPVPMEPRAIPVKSDKLAIPEGTTVSVRLLDPLDTSSDEPLRAEVLEPVIAHGDVLLPVDAIVSGRASYHSNRALVHFDTVKLPGGKHFKIAAVSLKSDGREGIDNGRFEYGDAAQNEHTASNILQAAGAMGSAAIGALPGGNVVATGAQTLSQQELSDATNTSGEDKAKKKDRITLPRKSKLTIQFSEP